jgi:hypothetical protein
MATFANRAAHDHCPSWSLSRIIVVGVVTLVLAALTLFVMVVGR